MGFPQRGYTYKYSQGKFDIFWTCNKNMKHENRNLLILLIILIIFLSNTHFCRKDTLLQILCSYLDYKSMLISLFLIKGLHKAEVIHFSLSIWCLSVPNWQNRQHADKKFCSFSIKYGKNKVDLFQKKQR